MSVNVRDAQAEELDGLARAVALQPLLERYQIAADRLAMLLREALERGDPLIVAEEGGRARGFAWFLPSQTLGAGGYLRLIALEPGSEGHGLGAALLDELEHRVSQSSRHLFLLVSHWNEAARRFYARRGYSEVGRLPAFVRDDTDEIICWKKLR
jgi:ribosomal protein S18 acetylase RimI-like enzyme